MRPLLLIGFCLGSLALAVPYESTLFEKGSGFSKPLYQGKREEAGPNKATVKHLSLEGTVVTQEEAVVEGVHVKAYDLDHIQIGEKGSLRVEGDKVHFSYTREGKTKTATEDLPDNLIVGPTTVEYLKAHWPEILKGDTVSVRYAALDRRETVGFKFFKIEDKAWEGEESVVVKMKPTSFIIAAIVDPILFTMRKKDGRLLALVGRTVPKLKEDGKWKDLDVEVKFRYPSQG